jgi:signal peptidase II
MRTLIPWCTAIAIVIADRLTKLLVIREIPAGGWRSVAPGVALTHVHNRGIAFSLFSEGGWLSRIILHGVILTAVVLIAWMLFRHGQRQPMAGLAFGLILGGAVGNLIDRVMYGWVVDFIHLWVRIGDRSWAWPDFNVADSAITVGAGLLILNELLIQRHSTNDASDSD